MVERSVDLEGLFPNCEVIAFESHQLEAESPLYPEELSFIANAVEGRRSEFATGRACARAAITELGLVAGDIPVGSGRQPVWPAGVTAAITHTRRQGRTYVAAVAARTDGSFGIGLDAEVIQPLKDGVRAMIVTDLEQAKIDQLAQSEHDAAVIGIFSAKEAFYKAQYSITASWVGFGDMALVGSELLAQTELPALDQLVLPVGAQQLTRDELIISGVVVQRRSS